MEYYTRHIKCMWFRLKASLHFSLAATVGIWYKLLGDNIRWQEFYDIAYRRMIWADYSNSVSTRANIMLVDKIWASYSSVPYPKGQCYLDIVQGLSYRHRPTFNKYRAIMMTRDARAILDVFYVQNEIDEGVYKALLNSKHKVYEEINNFLEIVGHEPLELERLDHPFVECIFVPMGTAVEKPLVRKATCLRSDGYLVVGRGYSVTGEFLPGWFTLAEEPFMSYKGEDFKFEDDSDAGKTIFDPLSSTI